MRACSLNCFLKYISKLLKENPPIIHRTHLIIFVSMSFNPFLKNESRYTSTYNNKSNRVNFSSHKSPSDLNTFSQRTSIKVDNNSFPELFNKSSDEKKDLVPTPNLTDTNSVINYKKVVTNNLDNNKLIADKLPQGWIGLHGNRRNIINKKTETILEEPNKIMAKIVDKLDSNSLRYKSLFEEINGEGSYDERYYLSPVFDETDDESDEESSINDEIVDELII